MNQKHTEPWEEAMLRLNENAKLLGFTHEDIAQKSGLLPSTVKRVMTLKYCPSLKVYLKIAEVVGIY